MLLCRIGAHICCSPECLLDTLCCSFFRGALSVCMDARDNQSNRSNLGFCYNPLCCICGSALVFPYRRSSIPRKAFCDNSAANHAIHAARREHPCIHLLRHFHGLFLLASFRFIAPRGYAVAAEVHTARPSFGKGQICTAKADKPPYAPNAKVSVGCRAAKKARRWALPRSQSYRLVVNQNGG